MSFFVKWADTSCLPARFLRSAVSSSAWLSRFLCCSLSAETSPSLRCFCSTLVLLVTCFSISSFAKTESKTKWNQLERKEVSLVQLKKRQQSFVQQQKKWKKQNRKLAQAEQEERKARGVILRFYRWPSFLNGQSES